MKFITSNNYRRDIDGLRSFAVVSVILFHFGLLPNGFLGVDIFFVISGYLITGIIYKALNENSFSVKDFYIRRTKRIIPLVSFICLITIITGTIFMLPDDLENLAQSLIATNLFGNNILAVLTTKNYWDVVNEYKPLMHTWSLAIEEQYYLLYPFLFLFIGKKRIKWILPILLGLTVVSIILFFSPFPQYYKFYLLPFRFFELSIGGVSAILLNRRLINHNFSFILLILIIIILSFEIQFIPNNVLLFITILFTTGILISANSLNKISSSFLENKIAVFIGKISFSLYMWHQVILAFSRYFIFQELTPLALMKISIVTIILSIMTYYFIEKPFRFNYSFSKVLVILSILFGVTTGFSYYIYSISGVLKDVPELGIIKQKNSKNMHSFYNDRIYELDKNFINNKRIKVLIIGNSFARDWGNILLESKLNNLEISYIYSPKNHPEFETRTREADVIFYSSVYKKDISDFVKYESKIWCVGPKNFGMNNGYYYNYSGKDYCSQRTKMEYHYYQKNNSLEKEWVDRYINLIDLIIDANNTVPIFTPDCKFISQDCRHLTKFGAKYFAQLLEQNNELKTLFEKK